jgi:uncharacterized membrane protein
MVKSSHTATSEADLMPGPTAARGRESWLPARAALILALTAGCIASVASGWVSPVRVVLALGFLLLCPGLALAELLDVRDLAQRLAIAIAASLALDTLLSLLLVYAGAFSIPVIVSILAALTLTALCAALVRAVVGARHDRAVDAVQ